MPLSPALKGRAIELNNYLHDKVVSCTMSCRNGNIKPCPQTSQVFEICEVSPRLFLPKDLPYLFPHPFSHPQLAQVVQVSPIDGGFVV